MKTIKDFHGFESLHGMDEDLMDTVIAFLEKNQISSEFTGTLRFTIQYLETVEPIPRTEEWTDSFRKELPDFLRADFDIHPGTITNDQIANGEWRRWIRKKE